MAETVTLTTESNKLIQKKYTDQYVTDKTDAWLSCELRLDDFSIKNQSFEITGWINVFWKWDDKNMPDSAKILNCFNGVVEELNDECKSKENHITNKSQMIIYKNSRGDEIVKIGDLRYSDITYYLPIDANKIFYRPSLQAIHYIDTPCLYYNKQTQLVHTQFYINVVLLEHLELFMFPFDRQFLNIKLRWNVDFYKILHYDQENHVPIDGNWWGVSGEKSCERSKNLYHVRPLKISLKETLQNEVKMYPAWIDLRIRHKTNDKKEEDENNGLRFALIRIRVRRNPAYFVTNIIFPLFVIVTSSFSVFAIDAESIGDRLGVSVTILLTFTAFQSIIADELPASSDMLLIDYYISLAYLLQAVLICGSCIASLDIVDMDTSQYIDMWWSIISGTIWVIFSLFYLSMRWKSFRDCYDICFKKLKCCGLSKINYNDWKRRGNEEIQGWVINNSNAVGWDEIIA